MVSVSVISTRSPHESPKNGIRPAPKRIFQVITFRLSIVWGSPEFEDAVYVSALSTSSKVVTNGRQEKIKMTAKQAERDFKLELPVKGKYRCLIMNTKSKMFICSIHKSKIEMNGANIIEIRFYDGMIYIHFIGIIFTKGPILI